MDEVALSIDADADLDIDSGIKTSGNSRFGTSNNHNHEFTGDVSVTNTIGGFGDDQVVTVNTAISNMFGLQLDGDARVFKDIVFEGGVEDANEVTLNVDNPFTDITVNLPTTDGTLALTSDLPTGGNPSAEVGLTVVNGSSLQFMRRDAAPPLSQAISPTWTGDHTFNSGVEGVRLLTGTPLVFYNDTLEYISLAPESTPDGAYDIDLPLASGTVALTSDIPLSANPSATVNGTVTNGSTGTWMRSDAAPALADPFTPADGTQNITGALTASGALEGSNFKTASSSKILIGESAPSPSGVGVGNILLSDSFPDIEVGAIGNVVAGFQAGLALQDGARNVLLGYGSGSSLTGPGGGSFDNASWNVFVGNSAGAAATTMEQAVLIGLNAGRFGTTGVANVGIGESSLYRLLDGVDNTAVGSDTGWNPTDTAGAGWSGDHGSFFGNNAGLVYTSVDGSFNGVTPFIASDGESVTAVGHGAGFAGASPMSFRSAFGAGAIATVDNSVVLGRTADTVYARGDLNVGDDLTVTDDAAAASLTTTDDFWIDYPASTFDTFNTWTPVNVGTYTDSGTADDRLFFHIPYKAGSVITRVRIKFGGASNMNIRLFSNDATGTSTSVTTLIDVTATATAGTGTLSVQTFDPSDVTLSSGNQYLMTLRKLTPASTVRIYSIGVEYGTAAY